MPPNKIHVYKPDIVRLYYARDDGILILDHKTKVICLGIRQEDKMKIWIKSFFIVCINFIIICTIVQTVFSNQETHRAKLGIQISSQNNQSMAKSRDEVRSGDLFRIFVYPEKPSHIYVVLSDKKAITLLSMIKPAAQGKAVVLPSADGHYKIDGKTAFKTITIICSPDEIKMISNLSISECSPAKWEEMEKDLNQKSKLIITERSDTSMSLGGGVKGGIDFKNSKVPVDKLLIYSGNSFLVKKYEFWIKE